VPASPPFQPGPGVLQDRRDTSSVPRSRRLQPRRCRARRSDSTQRAGCTGNARTHHSIRCAPERSLEALAEGWPKAPAAGGFHVSAIGIGGSDDAYLGSTCSLGHLPRPAPLQGVVTRRPWTVDTAYHDSGKTSTVRSAPWGLDWPSDRGRTRVPGPTSVVWQCHAGCDTDASGGQHGTVRTQSWVDTQRRALGVCLSQAYRVLVDVPKAT